jgi:hypothetical protein
VQQLRIVRQVFFMIEAAKSIAVSITALKKDNGIKSGGTLDVRAYHLKRIVALDKTSQLRRSVKELPTGIMLWAFACLQVEISLLPCRQFITKYWR